MKVLIIGNADSIWVKSLVEKTHLRYGDAVSVLTPKNSVYNEYYRNNNVRIYKIHKLKSAWFLVNLFKNLSYLAKGYDIISVQYTEGWNAFWGTLGRCFNKKMILSFWGSDLLRLTEPDKKVLHAIKRSTFVTLTTDEMVKKFLDLYGNKYKEKIRMTKFGSNGIDFLNRHFDIEDIKERYGISSDKVVVSIGYNKMKEQQHLAVLNVINSLSDELRSRIHIILRLTYGSGDNEYVRQIKELVAKSQCTYTVFEKYMSDVEVAEITQITDVFIHAQTTDARSASMSEHLYANCLVINPDWIDYPDFNVKVFYLKFKDFNDLRDILADNIVKKENSRYRDKLESNTKIISDLCSWDSLSTLWRTVYEEM